MSLAQPKDNREFVSCEMITDAVLQMIAY